MIKISIIIPVYNVEDYLEDLLFSLINQTFEDIEIICINDESTDNSLDILTDFANKDSRIKIINQKKSGAAIARNYGLSIAKGDYIHFIDADDIITINMLEKLYNNAISNNSDFVVFKSARFDELNTYYNMPIFDLDELFENVNFNKFTFSHKDIKRYVFNASFAPWTKFYKKEFLVKNNIKFQDVDAYNDVLFHVKSMLKASRISFVPEFLYYYRLNNTNSITLDSTKHLKIFEVIDSVEKFIVEDNYYEEYQKEFDLFKIVQISRHMKTPLSDEYFSLAKNEFLKIDIENNHLITDNHLTKYNILLNLDEHNINYLDKFLILENLKEETNNLTIENNRLNKELNKQKNLFNDITNSNSWKITKYLRIIRNFSLKKMILNKSDTFNFYKKENEKLINENNLLKKDFKNLKSQYNQLNTEYFQIIKNINESQDIFLKKYEKNFEFMNNKLNIINNDFVKRDNFNKTLFKELQYASVFEDTIQDSEWLKQKNFSLINGAANYSFMYSLYRILDDAHPKNILELGLGQTSKLTTQYVNFFKESKLTILEGDQVWIDNFSKNLNLSDNINIVNLDLEKIEYDNTQTLRFKNILAAVNNQKFDLIIIDGPQGFMIGSDNKSVEFKYSRTNILELIPANLSKDFIILIDDYERIGEKNTLNEVKRLLNENSLNFHEYNSWAFKTQHAVFSDKFKYLSWI